METQQAADAHARSTSAWSTTTWRSRPTDGLRLVGWYVPTQNGAVVLAQHGYKSQRGEMLDEAAMLHRHGYGVLITTIRAHDHERRHA